MNLKSKVAAALVAVMVILTLAYYGVFHFIILESFIDLENRSAERDMNRCLAAFERDLVHLDRFVHDWASWDDTYRFVQDGNKGFINANLVWQVFQDQKLNLIHIYDHKGRLIWGKTYDLTTGKEIPLDLNRELGPVRFKRLVNQEGHENSMNDDGVIQTGHGPMVVASNPILTSENKGPCRGTIIMGRFFTNKTLSVLSEQVNVELRAWPANKEKVPKELQGLLISLQTDKSFKIKDVSPERLHVYSIIKDIAGRPALLLEASIPREIMKKGGWAYSFGMFFMLGVGLVILLSVSGFLQIMVLRPISELTKNVLAVGGATEVPHGLVSMRRDEIGILWREFGGMVDRLVQRQRDLDLGEKRLRQIIDLVPQYIYAKDAEGRFILVNKAVADLSGTTPKDLVGKKDVMFARLNEQSQAIQGEDMEVIGSKDAKNTIQEEIIDSLGNKHYVKTARIPFSLADISTPAVLNVSADITDELELENQLRQAQKMEVVGRLAGGVAHDLNNMLSPILGYAEIILSEMPKDNPQYEDIMQIKAAADRARNLTRQLLAFGRKQVLEMKVVDLAEVVASYGKMLRRIIREDINIQIMQSLSRGAVRVDISQMGQVLMNLAVNAQDAMPEGGTISIDLSDVTVDEAYARIHRGLRPGEYVALSFKDTGTGINSQIQEHIFEPFFTTKERGKGTGLGLAMVYGIVAQHGGYIVITSETGKGTAFTIYLPRVDEAPEYIAGTREVVKGKQGSETVVLAEDDDGVRELVFHILKRHGYNVITAKDAEGLFRVLDKYNGTVDLLITDVIMPGMNGRELFERLRSSHSELKVIYMSGYTDDVIASQGVLEEGVHFIQKPFTLNTLTDKIRSVMDS